MNIVHKTSKELKQSFYENKPLFIEWFLQNDLYHDFDNDILHVDFKIITEQLIEKYVEVEESSFIFWKKKVLRKRCVEVFQYEILLHHGDMELRIQYHTNNQTFNVRLYTLHESISVQMWIPRKVTDGSYYVIQLINKLFDEFERSIS